MPFSFNPGQQQPTAPQGGGSLPAVNNDGVPVLQVPVVPTITTGPVEEKISPFAFRNRSKSKFGVYFQFAVFGVFGILLILAVGIFMYQRILLSQIDTLKGEIDTKQATFPAMKLQEMVKFSQRLKIVNTVINERVSANSVFSILEATIQDPVTYTKFSFGKSKTKKEYSLSFEGETSSYYSLYQQVEALKSKLYSRVFSSVDISGTGPLDKKGLGYFKVNALIKIQGIDPDDPRNFVFTSDDSKNDTKNSTTTTSQNQVATTTDVNGTVVPVPTLNQVTP